MFGWAGRRLRVNLAKGTIKKEPIPDETFMNFMGGRGFNSKTLYDELEPDIDPLWPKNKLIFGTGPITGTVAACSSRYTVTAKSPVTGYIGDGNSGGLFGHRLKWAGYDQLIIEEKSDTPVYLWIDDDAVEIRDASNLWGEDTWETTKKIEEDVDDKNISVCAIGPAGENEVAASAIINEYARAAAKTGIGAVMGSKKLKAVAIRGTKGVKVADPKGVQKIFYKYLDILKVGDTWWFNNFSKYGTPIFVDQYNHLGAMPTYNWKEGTFKGAKDLGLVPFYNKYARKKRGCGSCIYGCSPFFLIEGGEFDGTTGEGVEYEAMTGFGSKIGSSNLELALVAGTLCDKLGLDYISASEAIAWAYECYNEGILDKGDTDGYELNWGNSKIIPELLEKMAYKKNNFGKLLALGSHKASKKIGKGTEKFDMTIKGQQPGSMDPRICTSWGVGYAVAARGGDHLRTHLVCEYMFTKEEMNKYVGTPIVSERWDWTERKADLVVFSENVRTIVNCLEYCVFFCRGEPRIYVDYPVEILKVVTGKEWNHKNVLECAERITTLERAFNIREGITREEDRLPDRFYEEELDGHKVPRDKWENIIDRYYALRGWDKRGFPTRERLSALGLDYIADELEKLGKLGEE